MSVKHGRASSNPYKHYIEERVKAAAPDWIPATVLLRELQALGYETEPGRQMQADFATIRCERDRLAVFIATLGG